MKPIQDTCEVCGKKFKRKAYWQKFCSGSCRLAAWAKRKFERKE